MRLLGDWHSWAPRPLKALHARFGLAEAPRTVVVREATGG
jgi:hypothetical protein